MRGLHMFLQAFRCDQRGAIALNTGLALIPVMIALSFAFDRAHA